jgi:membrane fusion protein, macrolide-specific efflux system
LRKFLRKHWWVLLLPLVLGVVLFYTLRPKKAAVQYYTVQVQREDLQSTVLSTGVAQPQNRVEIKPPVSGRMDQVLVKEGQFLHRDQVLAYMSSSERTLLLDSARALNKQEEARWAEMYKPIPIVAPLDGILIKRAVEPGQTVSAGDVLLVMSNHLIVNGQVDETDLGRIQVGQQAVITLDAYPDMPIDAVVDRIAYEAQNVNNVTVYNVDVLPKKIPPVMRSGMTANVNFITAKRTGVLVLPFESIQRDKGKATVLVPDPQNPQKVVSKEIQTGLSDGQKVEVVSGLKEGDTVKVAVVDLGDGPNPIPPWDRKKK